jgi:hypothetical protein
MSAPTWLASGASLTTIACGALTGARPAGYAHAAGNDPGCRSPARIYPLFDGSGCGVPTSVAPCGGEIRGCGE